MQLARESAGMASGADMNRPPVRDARRVWLELIDQAQRQAGQVERGEAIERFAAAAFARVVIQARRAAFPAPHASAQDAAKAMLTVAQAFAVAARPEDRRRLARFVAAGARCLDAILTDHGHAQTQAWRRNFPDEEL